MPADLTSAPYRALLAEWHHLGSLPRSLRVRTDLAAVELELLRRSWEAPPAERGES